MTATNAKISISMLAPALAEIIENIEVTNMISEVTTRVRLNIQSNGRANTSVTNEITHLHHTAKNVPHTIRVIGLGSTCTHKRVF